MKKTIKKILPQSIMRGLKKINLIFKLFQEYVIDFKRFYQYSSIFDDRVSHDQIRAKLTYYYHAIEKGLSNNNIRFEFGKKALDGLYDTLILYDVMNFPKDDTRYLTALSVISHYIDLHESNFINVDNIRERFSNFNIENKNEFGGAKTMERRSDSSTKSMNFKELSQARVSIRDFSDELLDNSIINEAISIAMKTPSVCNRQPWKVHLIFNRDLINKIVFHQKGFKGSEEKEFALILITTDNQFYLGVNERNQGYIDGGLFSMSLLYALEYVGLSACALNGSLRRSDEQKIRQELNICDSENIVMFIATGHYPEKTKVPKSKRDDYTIITKVYE